MVFTVTATKRNFKHLESIKQRVSYFALLRYNDLDSFGISLWKKPTMSIIRTSASWSVHR